MEIQATIFDKIPNTTSDSSKNVSYPKPTKNFSTTTGNGKLNDQGNQPSNNT